MISNNVYSEAPTSNVFKQQTSYTLSASGNSHRPLILLENIQCFQEGTGLPRVHQACASCRQILPRVANLRGWVSMYHRAGQKRNELLSWEQLTYCTHCGSFYPGFFVLWLLSWPGHSCDLRGNSRIFSGSTAADRVW